MSENDPKIPPLHKGNGGKVRLEAPTASGAPQTGLRMSTILILVSAMGLALCATADVDPRHPALAVWRAFGFEMLVPLIRGGAFASYMMEAGEYWRLLSSLFLHVGILHLLFNMTGMVFFAQWLETRLGRWRFLALYLISGVAGNFFIYAATAISALAMGNPEIGLAPSVGASGAVFGLFGAVLANEWVERGSLRKFMQSSPLRYSTLAIWLFLSVMLGFYIPLVSGIANLGGMIAGFAMGLFFFVSLSANPAPRMRAISHNSLYALVAIAIVCFFASTRPVKTDHDFNRYIVSLLTELGRGDLALTWAEKKMAAAGEDLQKAPTSDDAFHWRRLYAHTLIQNCEYDRARQQIAWMLEKKSDDPLSRYLSGILNWRAGRLPQAEADFRIASVDLAEDLATTSAAARMESVTTGAATRMDSATTGAIRIPAAAPGITTVTIAAAIPRIEAMPAETLLKGPETTPSAGVEVPVSSVTLTTETVSEVEREALVYTELAQMNLAVVLKQMGRMEESAAVRDALAIRFMITARAAMRKAAELRGQDAGKSWFGYLLENRDLEVREEQMRAAQSLNQAAWLCAVLDVKLDEGLSLINEAIRLFKDPAFIDTRGWIYFKKGQLSNALTDLLDAARDSQPPSAEIMYHIGALLSALNRYGDARPYLERALELKQDFDGISEARRLLKAIEPKSKGPATSENMATGSMQAISRENAQIKTL